MNSRYLLVTDQIRAILDGRHYSHQRAAQRLGVSRSYWSQLINGRRSLTPDMRARILECPLFAGLPEEQLWRIEHTGDDEAAQ